VISVRQVQTT